MSANRVAPIYYAWTSGATQSYVTLKAHVQTTHAAVLRDIKNPIYGDLEKRCMSNKPFLSMASVLDPHSKGLPLLGNDKRQHTCTTVALGEARISQVRVLIKG